MPNITLTLDEKDISKLESMANKSGKSIQLYVSDMIKELPENSVDDFKYNQSDVENDPLYKMEGYDFDAPPDFSINHDEYIYEKSSDK